MLKLMPAKYTCEGSEPRMLFTLLDSNKSPVRFFDGFGFEMYKEELFGFGKARLEMNSYEHEFRNLEMKILEWNLEPYKFNGDISSRLRIEPSISEFYSVDIESIVRFQTYVVHHSRYAVLLFDSYGNELDFDTFGDEVRTGSPLSPEFLRVSEGGFDSISLLKKILLLEYLLSKNII